MRDASWLEELWRRAGGMRRLRTGRRSDQRFVTEEIGGEIVAGSGDDDLWLDFFEEIADFEEFLELFVAGDENDLRAAVIEDVGHAVGRFVEVNGTVTPREPLMAKSASSPRDCLGVAQADFASAAPAASRSVILQRIPDRMSYIEFTCGSAGRFHRRPQTTPEIPRSPRFP